MDDEVLGAQVLWREWRANARWVGKYSSCVLKLTRLPYIQQDTAVSTYGDIHSVRQKNIIQQYSECWKHSLIGGSSEDRILRGIYIHMSCCFLCF